jgi:hypothetical protein
VFIEGLIDNLQGLLDKYIMSGSPKKVRRVVFVRVMGRYQSGPWIWKNPFLVVLTAMKKFMCCFVSS